MKLFFLISMGFVAILAEESKLLQEFAEGNVKFVGNLYKEKRNTTSNSFLICPLSIQSVFALVNSGAKGNTERQITSSLHLPEGSEKIKKVFHLLADSLQTSDKYTLSSANKIYVANSFKISESFKRTTVDVFRARIQNIDFTKSQEAVRDINKWVEERTHNKIKNLMSEDMVGANTVAVLINALYFQGKWATTFSQKTLGTFLLNNRETESAYLMEQTHFYNYYESAELKAKYLEIPYDGNEVSMVFILPNDIEGLSALEDRIDEALAPPKFSMEGVKVVIPKFNIDSTTHLIPILNRLGITDAFTSAANFSGIGENQEPLSISEVIQKTYMEVDEQGTTAAAATMMSLGRSARVLNDYTFVANHPFMFYLKHRVNGIFFIGRLNR